MIHRQFLVFVCVGGISALVDIATMEGLLRLGAHYALAASIGFVVGLIVNYVLHSRVTFSASSSLGGMIKFGAVVLVNYGITIAFVYASQRWMGSALAGKIASLPVVAGNGFLLSKYWVFR